MFMVGGARSRRQAALRDCRDSAAFGPRSCTRTTESGSSSRSLDASRAHQGPAVGGGGFEHEGDHGAGREGFERDLDGGSISRRPDGDDRVAFLLGALGKGGALYRAGIDDRRSEGPRGEVSPA